MEKLKFILLVDDDAIANYLNQLIIEELEITEVFKSVNNGLEALQYLKDIEEIQPLGLASLSPDLILLDLNMPVLSGLEFLDFFNKMFFKGKEKIKIVVLTSSNNINDIQSAFDLGATDYLIKPLSSQKVKEIISRHFFNGEPSL